ncbi:tryptophan synthase beta subunit-like PLP-dependent enzyme [Trametes versicolor FP-101664 SS1]|uniref:tryptophan synthase beta subunit-like PLP-dependent enzyme n=1 Tax=Trametes versicolor (strain FP-101664) TaxID=717944 RepID=UPI0004621E92|nr:tryptophan synthase beta subunit-like PLP-dependent enzyme [Trametes versicolor FP-101664 SS1]EIW61527.1 tryptophan synthase beta subunit-like PLP-dependent enzyme [Trametes versicolor FP-101664 SS1]
MSANEVTRANAESTPLTRASILAAHEAIVHQIHRTPVFTSSSLSALLPGKNTLYFKAENLQKGGAFKFRGASYSLSRLTAQELERGVCTHSSGNHAGALALAAKERGAKCYVVMPNNSAQPKIDAVRSYGASITFCEPNAPARAAALATVQAETGATFVPPYDAVNTILGQGTALLELVEQAPEPLAAVIAPVGGGGLLAGTALAAEGTGVRVFGAEPAGADDCAQGLKEGKRREDVQADTIADGLRTPVGLINFPIIQEKVDKVITVTDEEIVEAMRLMWERLKLVVEPSGAAAFAAVRSAQFQELGVQGAVGIIISGGNIDLSKPLPWVRSE